MEISKQRYIDLRCAEAKLACLEAGGVDDWEWYGESLEDYDEQSFREELQTIERDPEDD